jgi:glyoxylase-like metal-dependent hydrolase (beta-lactamase superfamily II)
VKEPATSEPCGGPLIVCRLPRWLCAWLKPALPRHHWLGAWLAAGLLSCTAAPPPPPNCSPLPPDSGVRCVRAGSTLAYLLVGPAPADLVLINAGSDPQGTALLGAVQAAGRQATDVQAILLTDGLRTHRAALAHFPTARVYVGSADLELAHDRQLPAALWPRLTHRWGQRPPAAAVDVVLPGTLLHLGSLQVHAVNLSGFTAGSMGYVYQGIGFVGHSLHLAPGRCQLWPKPWSARPADTCRALGRLQKLAPQWVADSTYGAISTAMTVGRGTCTIFAGCKIGAPVPYWP